MQATAERRAPHLARWAQLRQALLAEAEYHPRVDELGADRVNANILFLCEVRERPREVDHACLRGGVDRSARHWPQADQRCGIDDHTAMAGALHFSDSDARGIDHRDEVDFNDARPIARVVGERGFRRRCRHC
jgi:hypothetical protein